MEQCCLFPLFLTLNRNVRKKDISKFHIQLALSILLVLTEDSVDVIIALSVEGTLNQVICIIISALHHYLLIAQFMWMAAEGVLLCQKVVCVFKKTTTLYLFIVSFICWGKCLDKCSSNHATHIYQKNVKHCGGKPSRDTMYYKDSLVLIVMLTQVICQLSVPCLLKVIYN